MHITRTLSLWALAASLVLACTARAALVGADFINITASNENGSGSWKLVIPPGWNFPANGKHTWNLPAPVTIWNAGHSARLADIQSLELEFVEDPIVSLGFVVVAGGGATNFTISSATLNFPAMSNPDAAASSGLTVTDNNGDGASITGQLTGGKSYRATYNSSVDWALLNSDISAGVFGSNVSNDRRPAAGFETIGASVTSISSQYSFVLSANDSASGTSVFAVVPEPALIGLLGFAALGLRRRCVR